MFQGSLKARLTNIRDWRSLVLAIFFCVLPFLIVELGFSWTLALGFDIGSIALLSDSFLTKIALSTGHLTEANPLMRVLTNRFGLMKVSLASRAFAISLLLAFMILRNEFFLLGLGLAFMIPVIANSMTLLVWVSTHEKVG